MATYRVKRRKDEKGNMIGSSCMNSNTEEDRNEMVERMEGSETDHSHMTISNPSTAETTRSHRRMHDSEGEDGEREGDDNDTTLVDGEGERDDSLPSAAVDNRLLQSKFASETGRPVDSTGIAAELTEVDANVVRYHATRLRTCLKCISALRWCMFEWFYSSIDHSLLQGQNEFYRCLCDLGVPQISALRRHEWAFLRRKLGRPRRLSQAFLNDDVENLRLQRQRIRMLQQGKTAPEGQVISTIQIQGDIPMSLVVGDRVVGGVAARYMVRVEGQGGNITGIMYPGCILAVDSVCSTYRVQFDRPELGIHTLPDIDVMSVEPPPTMPIDFKKRLIPPSTPLSVRPNFNLPPVYPVQPQLYQDVVPLSVGSNGTVSVRNAIKSLLDVTLSGITDPDDQPTEMIIGQWPSLANLESSWDFHEIQFLTRLYKVMRIKKALVDHIKDMNDKAERVVALCGSEGLEKEFSRQYAWTMVQLHRVEEMIRPAMTALLAVANRDGSGKDNQVDNQEGGIDGKANGRPEDTMERIRHAATNMAKTVAATLKHRNREGQKQTQDQPISEALQTAATNCLLLLLQIKTCAQETLPPVKVASNLQSAMTILKPRHQSNMGLYREMEHCIACIKSSITSGSLHDQ